jgi:hypothetical protein
MGITDIPDQIAKAVKYSLRSPGRFAISLVTAVVVFGIGYDLIYGFIYVRLYDVKDVRYGGFYGWGLLAVALVLPATIGIVAYLRAHRQARPFESSAIGVAIAPFEVFCVAPETLGTASMLQALDIVGTEFISVVENTLIDYEWAKELEFRFLPQYMRVRRQEEAIELRSSLGATLLIWGVITQRSRQLLDIRLELQGSVKNYSFTNFTIEDFPMLPLQFFTLLEAATRVRATGDVARARHLFEQARLLAVKINKGGLVAEVDANLAQLSSQLNVPPLPEASAATNKS